VINEDFFNPALVYASDVIYPVFSGPVLFADTCGEGCIVINDWENYPPQNFTFTQVPEPGTLALAALALVAAGSAARRTRPGQTRRTK
jgi:hypothetical protein